MAARTRIPWVLDRVIVFGLPIVVLTLLQRAGVPAWMVNSAMDQQQQPPPPAALLAASGVMMVPALLVYGLGQAVAARMLLGTAALIHVGARAEGLEVQMGGVTVRLVRYGLRRGAAELEPGRATADRLILITLGGPLASLAGALASWRLLDMAGPTMAWLHTLVWAFCLVNACLVATLLPYRAPQGRGRPLAPSSGRLIMDALAVKWALR